MWSERVQIESKHARMEPQPNKGQIGPDSVEPGPLLAGLGRPQPKVVWVLAYIRAPSFGQMFERHACMGGGCPGAKAKHRIDKGARQEQPRLNDPCLDNPGNDPIDWRKGGRSGTRPTIGAATGHRKLDSRVTMSFARKSGHLSSKSL